jgi:hypothetical protein
VARVLRHARSGRAHSFIAMLLAGTCAHAEMSAEDLAKIAQNPISNLISFPVPRSDSSVAAEIAGTRES